MTKDEKQIWVKFAIASLSAGVSGKGAAYNAEEALQGLRNQELNEML